MFVKSEDFNKPPEVQLALIRRVLCMFSMCLFEVQLAFVRRVLMYVLHVSCFAARSSDVSE